MTHLNAEEHALIRKKMLLLKASPSSVSSKKIRKLVEEFILEFDYEYRSFLGPELFDKVCAHREEVSAIAVSDSSIHSLIIDEVLDCIMAYLAQQPEPVDTHQK